MNETKLTGIVHWKQIDEGKGRAHWGAELETGCKGVRYYLIDPTDKSRTFAKQKEFKQFAEEQCNVVGRLNGSHFYVDTIETTDHRLSHRFRISGA